MSHLIKTGNSAQSWSPDVNTFHADDILPGALLLQTSTVAGEVEGDAQAVRVAVVRDDVAGFVPEGEVIEEAEPELDECVVYTGKVAQLVRLSNEQYGQPRTAELMAASFGRALVRAADLAYLTQTAPGEGAVTPPTGLLNVPGILDGGTITGNLDALIDTIADLEANGATPSHIIASPTAWASLRKFKTATDENTTLLGAGTSDATKMLLGIPVLIRPAMPACELLVVDKRAIVSATGTVRVSVSPHAYFNSDAVAMRATWRFGQNVVWPDRLAKFVVVDGE